MLGEASSCIQSDRKGDIFMKKVKVVTYSSPDDSIISDICNDENVLHICATASLTEAMMKKFGKRQNVISAKWFIDALLGEWMDMPTKLEQIMDLSELVRKGSDDNPDDKPITRAIRRYKSDALLTIRMLAEIGLKPKDLRECGITEYEKELSRLWEKMLLKDKEKGHFKKLDRFNFAQKRPFAFRIMANERMKEKFDRDIKEGENLCVSREKLHLEGSVVLHGFYFLTPIQQSVFQSLKNAAVNLTFLQLYNSNYPKTFSFIETVLGDENNWVPKGEWVIHQEGQVKESQLSLYMADFFEDRISRPSTKVHKERVTQICYRNLYQWMKDFRENLEKEEAATNYLTVMSGELDTRMKEFFPDQFLSERNFLSYPIGQYLLHLHKIWDQEKKKQEIDLVTIQECFASPWLYKINKITGKKDSASDYLYQLQFLANFFPQKMTMKEWKSNIKKLILDTERSSFLAKNIIGAKEHLRFLDEIKNPVKKIAPYSVPCEDWKIILEFLNVMDSHIETLFNNMDHLYSFKEYFSLLNGIITKQLPEAELLKHEKEMLRRIKKIANYYESSPSGKHYHIEDIAEAVHLLLSSQLDEKPDGHPDSDQHPNKKALRIRSFAEIDGIIFDEKKTIHVSGLDEFSFPNAESSLPWPLTLKAVEQLSGKINSLKAMLIREEHKDIIPRFLFYVLLSGKQNLTLSWFREWGERSSLGPSFYLKLLEDDSPKTESFEPVIEHPKTPAQDLRDDTVVYQTALSHYSDYALSELNICQRRFFYSYLTQQFSVYNSDFHYNFLFGNLYRLLLNFDANPAPLMKDVFPYWTGFRRAAKAAAAKTYNYTEKHHSFKYAGENYHALSGMKYLLYQNNGGEGWKQAWENKGYQVNQSSIALLEASPSSSCKYCPHEDFCPSARYAVDDERYGG